MRRRNVVLLGLCAVLAPIYLANASWLAAPPVGRPTLIAQRGVHQLSNGEPTDPHTGCTARQILQPRHRLIENTLPSIRAAIEAGADVVEVDVRETADGEFILFHDAHLNCRTDGDGVVNQTSYEQMRRLDVGYGYSADGGKTFPLRGSGGGLMTTLDEALRTFPHQRFMVQLKDGASAGTNLAIYINRRHPKAWKRIAIFGDKPATTALKALRPDVPVIHDRRAAKCTLGYLGTGWFGHVPSTCRNGTLIVPVSLRHLVWGWPNRLLARMKGTNTQVMMIGSVSGLSEASFTRLDDPASLHALPSGFDGMIWTDRIEEVGPAARKLWPS